MERKDKLILLLMLSGAGYAAFANWDTMRTKLGLDDLAPGRLKAIDLAKKDMTLDRTLANWLVLHERRRNKEIEMEEEPWDATRLEGNRFLVVVRFTERGQPHGYRFEVNTASGGVTRLEDGARPPR